MPETIVLTGDVYEEKENMLKIMENSVELMKKDLEQMKKTESIAPASQSSEKKWKNAFFLVLIGLETIKKGGLQVGRN